MPMMNTAHENSFLGRRRVEQPPAVRGAARNDLTLWGRGERKRGEGEGGGVKTAVGGVGGGGGEGEEGIPLPERPMEGATGGAAG